MVVFLSLRFRNNCRKVICIYPVSQMYHGNYNLRVQNYTQLLKANHQIQLNDLGTKKPNKQNKTKQKR